MRTITRERLRRRKGRIERRLRERHWTDQPAPMMTAGNIQYEVAERTRGMVAGGIGAMHLLARSSGLIGAIDRDLHLLKVHLPYHESDHVLNLAYNILAGGTCIEDIELLRNAVIRAVQTFPWLHTFIGNMKRMILGTYHSVAPKHLDNYLAEFVYRANRRWMEANLFDRLLVAAVTGKPMSYRELVTGDN